MKKHAIFMVFDDNFAKYAKACLNSVETNYPNHPEILVYYNGSDDSIITWLLSINNLTRMEYRENEELVRDLNLGPVNSATIYFRYNLWTDQFDEYDNVLHLDVDTLVMKPLDELFETDEFFITPNHEYFDFVRVFPKGTEENEYVQKQLAKDGLFYPSGMDDMANAGIFVIPKKYRTREYYDILLDITRRYNKYLNYADQSAISLWCHYLKIPFQARYEYNYQTPFLTFKDVPVSVSDAYIIHYSSDYKPDTDKFRTWWRLGKHTHTMIDLYQMFLNKKD